jgi:CheY-like chemotaxis protein
VLVVEDDDAMRRLMATTLDAFGYDVIEAGDGIDLLGWLGASLWDPSGDGVDIVVADVNLPDMTALEVMEALHVHHGGVPVILVTASDDPTVDERAYELGASLVLRKPFDVADLADLVTRVRRREAIPGARPPHGPGDATQDE